MEPIHRLQLLEITLVRGADRRYRAFVQMECAGGYAVGRDMLKGKGTTDPFASWQRLMYHNTELLKWWIVAPCLRPELDQNPKETRAEWGLRLATTPFAPKVPIKDHAGHDVIPITPAPPIEDEPTQVLQYVCQVLEGAQGKPERR